MPEQTRAMEDRLEKTYKPKTIGTRSKEKIASNTGSSKTTRNLTPLDFKDKSENVKREEGFYGK